MTTESPLQQVERGELKPKVLALYEQLFTVHPKSKGYWNEFFLLRCNQQTLTQILKEISCEDLISNKAISRELFRECVEHLESKDLAVVDNTLMILMIYLQCVYSKPFINYSSDVIDVFAGLDRVDRVFNSMLDGFTLIIDEAPMSSRIAAIRTATIAAGGAYQTSLAAYFTHKDMFSAVMGFIHSDGTDQYVGDAFSLIGLLASFDRFETHNPYRVRLADFVDDLTMQQIVDACGNVWRICIDRYNESSTPQSNGFLSSWVFGNGKAEASDVEPHGTISLMFAAYEFISTNKVFARMYVEGSAAEHHPQDPSIAGKATSISTSTSPPSALSNKQNKLQLPNFLTLCSWLFQTQAKISRTRTYSRVALLLIRQLLEDNNVMKLLVDERHAAVIPISQLRAPALPVIKSRRLLAHGVLDALQCCLRFNTKRSMDYEMYDLALTNTFQFIAYLRSSKTRLNYAWSELWRTLLSLMKFMNSHVNKSVEAVSAAEKVALILSVCLINGDTILPDSQQYDDLFYQLIGSATDLDKFKAAYFPKVNDPAMGVLIAACNHYKTILEANKTSKGFSSQQITEVIKQGYQTLSLHQHASSTGGGSRQTGYLLYDPLPALKESSERLFFKQATRTVITDIQSLYACI